MHEIGHQFDDFYGHAHNTKFAADYDNLLSRMITNPHTFKFNNQQELDLFYIYQYNNSLSDKKDFEDAIISDYMGIRLKKELYSEKLPNIEYYTQGINLSTDLANMSSYDDLTKDVKNTNIARREVYATLFSYALGEDDGKRDAFLKLFPKSYKIVLKIILAKNMCATCQKFPKIKLILIM